MRAEHPYGMVTSWVPSGPPAPKLTGKGHRNYGRMTKREAARRLLGRFLDSGDECWRRDYPEGRSDGALHRAAERDAQTISQAARALGYDVSVARRGSSVYLVRG